MSQKIKTSVEIDGSLSASQIQNATVDTDKFLVSDGGVVKYRTGTEMLSDLGVTVGTANHVQHSVKASVAINKGQAVYVTDADGTNMIVGLASNAAEATSSKTMGLLNATVGINGFADVITEGLLSGLNTSTAVVGNPVWLGTGGNLIYGLANKPYAPAHLVFIGIVTRVNANNGEIFVKVQNGFELEELHNVDLQTTPPANNDILTYEGGTVNLWKNKTIPAVLGYTPYNASNPSGYISSYTETDPTVPSYVKSITATEKTNWNTAYGWGNHASAGYLTTALAASTYASLTGSYSNPSWITGLAWSKITGAPAFITSYTETDTLASVTGRGAITSGDIYTPNNGGIFFNGNGVYGSGVFGRNAGQDLGLNAGGVERIRVLSTGFTGFGISNPLQKVHIEDSGSGSLLRLNNTAATWSSTMLYGTTTATAGGFDFIGMYANGSAKFNVGSTGTASAASDFRAPIFYDSNDTTYYIDPTSTGTSYRGRGEVLLGPNTSSQYLRLGGNGGATDYSTISTSNGNLHIDAKAANNLYLAWYNTSDIMVGGGIQALIYYDRNNTGYYVDPASTSNLNNVAVNRLWAGSDAGVDGSISTNNWFRSVGATGWYNQTYSGGWYMSDSTYVRSYNDNIVITNSSFRSPVFYDINDTAYYGDFASTSNFRNLLLNNQTSFNAATPGLTSYGLTLMGGIADYANGVTWTWGNTNAQAGVYVQSSGAYGTKMYFATTDSFTTGSKTGMSMDHNGTVLVTRSYLQSDSSLRAPVFYDSNDTAYYINPADADVSAVLKGTVTIGGGTGGNYDEGLRIIDSGSFSVITFGATGNAGPGRYQWLKNSSDVFELRNVNGSQIWWANQNGDVGTNYISYAGSSSRAPIFYDSNNTGYYVDPASTTQLNVLNTANAVNATYLGVQNTSSTSGIGISLYNNAATGQPQYGLMFAGTATFGTFGSVTADWATYFTMDSTANRGWIFRDTVNGNKASISNGGVATFAGDVVAYGSSDKELKDNITSIENALEKVKQIGGYSFDWNDKQDTYTGHDVGVIAQEIELVLPEIVTTRDNGYKAVKYEKIVPLLIEAIKEQQTQIEELKELVNKLINK
jgi:hypothetical protein